VSDDRSTLGEPTRNWPDWYSEYVVREQAGEELPQ
jgi:hypothetical protein